jgi:hypothetical protein
MQLYRITKLVPGLIWVADEPQLCIIAGGREGLRQALHPRGDPAHTRIGIGPLEREHMKLHLPLPKGGAFRELAGLRKVLRRVNIAENVDI